MSVENSGQRDTMDVLCKNEILFKRRVSNRIAVIYESRTGFTKTYAQWLTEELSCELFSLSEFCSTALNGYNHFIFGGGVCGNAINGLKKFLKLQAKHPNSSYTIFATGVREANAETIRMLRLYNFEDDESVKLYYFKGGIDLERLSPGQRFMLICLKAMIKRRNNISDIDREILKSMSFSYDYSDRNAIAPLVNAFKL